MKSHQNRILQLAKEKGVVRPSDLEPLGLPRMTLSRMAARGEMVRVGRGLYTLPGRGGDKSNLVARNTPIGLFRESHQSRILKLFGERTIIRTSELEQAGLPRVELTRMVERGVLERIGHGLYSKPDSEYSEFHSVVQVASRQPNAVFCLLTALRLHNLTTQAPFEVWFAIPHKAHHPVCVYPPVRVVRFRDSALEDGVETMMVENVKIKVTNVARTVVDCFKYRNKIGLDMALEALNEAWWEKRVTANSLMEYAITQRVSNVMRPYLESLS